MSHNAQLVWTGPARDTASLRHLNRMPESQTQVWLRRRQPNGLVEDALVYTTAPKQTRTTEAGVLLAVDSADIPNPTAYSSFEQEVYTRKLIFLTRNGSTHPLAPTAQFYALSLFRDS